MFWVGFLGLGDARKNRLTQYVALYSNSMDSNNWDNVLKTIFGGAIALAALFILGQFVAFAALAFLGFIGTLAATGQQGVSLWLLFGLLVSTVFFIFSIWGFTQIGLAGLKKIK